MERDLETQMQQLHTLAIKGKWEEVIKMYGQDPRLRKANFTRSGSTALHMAVFGGNEKVVEQMVSLSASCPQSCEEDLQTQDDRKNTALHIAAYMGNPRMCQVIASKHPSLVFVRNVDGETPLFLAAFHGKKETFLCLHRVSHPNGTSTVNYDNCRRSYNGDTILHSAVNGNFYDLAFQIIHLYPELVNWVNEEGLSPLHLLAGKPSEFKSAGRLGRYEMIIYHCIFVEELQVAQYHHHESFSEAGEHTNNCNVPDNYRTRYDFFVFMKTSLAVDDPEVARNNNIAAEYRAHGNTRQLYPENYEACYKFFRFVYLAVAVILGQGLSGFKRIRRKKEKHVWSLQIMNELLFRASMYKYENEGSNPVQDIGYDSDIEYAEEYALFNDPFPLPYTLRRRRRTEELVDEGRKTTETPILIAAKNGVAEMVEKIIELFPVAIHDMNEEKKNVVLLAVEHGQPRVYQLLLQWNILKESAFRKVDHEGNSALHLAAKFGRHKPSLIHGAAPQIMQWEIKWFEFVKHSMPSHAFARRNKLNETPKDIFFETHSDLVNSGVESLNKTSESCSVVAALVAGVSFAASSTVPGGNDGNTGKPTLQGQPGFDVFAISALLALCFSVTALIIFVSILTSQKLPSDFLKKLPMKLFVALSSLFVSIFSMFISFCAAHSFVVEDKFKKSVLPLYAIICLPVYFTIAAFPLYMDLFRGVFTKVQRPYNLEGRVGVRYLK